MNLANTILYVRRYTVHICICLLIGLVFALSTYHRPNMDGLMNNFQQFAADQFVKMKVSLISELENLNPDNITDASEQEVVKFKHYEFNATLSEWIYGCLDIFNEVAVEIGMAWWMTSGTLLGSYRHHAKIPWDGDMDIMADGANMSLFRTTFRQKVKNGSIKGFGLSAGSMPWDKVYFTKSTFKNGKPWGYPFVDIFWFYDNGTHISSKTYPTIAKKRILPLTTRPFGKKKYPSPRDPVDYLNNIYGTTDWNRECVSGGWDYAHEKYKPTSHKGTIKCAKLLKSFPFVRHIRGPGDSYCKEEQVMGGKVLSSFVRSAKDIPVC